MTMRSHVRDHYLPPDRDAYRRAEPPTGRIIVIAPTRAACETIELAVQLTLPTVLEREHGDEVRRLARAREGFGIVAGTGTGKTLAIRSIAQEILQAPLNVGVVNREREATPETPTWNVVIVTTGIARRWFQDELIDLHDTLIVDEIHQTSAELELCLALGKRVGCSFIWLSATVDPTFYASYLNSTEVLETAAFDPDRAATVTSHAVSPSVFLDERFVRRVMQQGRGVAVFLPTRAEVEVLAEELRWRWPRLQTAFYHGGEPIRVVRPFLEGTAEKPFVLAMTQAGQSALNITGLDTVVIYDACYNNIIDRDRNVLTRQHLGPNEILQMAGRVHGRVPNGEVYLLTDRDIEFEALHPMPPGFQLAGDTERVALTAAALGVDLTDLDLPVPLDQRAYAASVARLEGRDIIHAGQLTAYGRAVEAMPVDREWGELLVHADDELIQVVAVAANIDSLHRLTRDESDLRSLVVSGSDHLTGYNVVAEAINQCGYLGDVYGLPRHLFDESVAEWADARGVLVKALEDAALGLASVYRTLELPLPERMTPIEREGVRRFRDLVARVMPFELVIDEEMVDGQRVRLSKSSVCNRHSAVGGRVSFFADRLGVPRAAVEGTNISLELIRRYATRTEPIVEYLNGPRRSGLAVVTATEYFGFVLARERRPLHGRFPAELADQARETLGRELVAGRTTHRDQQRMTNAANRVLEYWRRSGGALHSAAPDRVLRAVTARIAHITSLEGFLEERLALDADEFVPPDAQTRLDRLPGSVKVLGELVPIRYEVEGGRGIALIKLREGQARRLNQRHVPSVDRPVRFLVFRGRREVARADSFGELRIRVQALKPDGRRVWSRRRR